MEHVCLRCGQPRDRGRLKNRRDRVTAIGFLLGTSVAAHITGFYSYSQCKLPFFKSNSSCSISVYFHEYYSSEHEYIICLSMMCCV